MDQCDMNFKINFVENKYASDAKIELMPPNPKLLGKKIGIYQILYKNSRFRQNIFSKYANNLKTTISRSLNNLVLLFLIL